MSENDRYASMARRLHDALGAQGLEELLDLMDADPAFLLNTAIGRVLEESEQASSFVTCLLSEEDINRMTALEEHCVICQNEGAHDVGDRPHAYEGQL